MADSEPAQHSGPSSQRLMYFQVRGETWLLKLKLIILAVLCVLLGTFLMIYKVQAHLQDLQKHNEPLKNFTVELSEAQSRLKELQAEKEILTNELTRIKKSYNAVILEKHNFEKNLTESRKRIQQLETEQKKLTALKVDEACCDKGWKYFRGKCYYFSTDVKTWKASRDACVAAGRDLLIISGKEEKDFLIRSKSGPGEQVYWIGLTDAVEEGDWRWLDGTKFNETVYWGKNQPDDWKGPDGQHPEGEDCVIMGLTSTYYYLMDKFCDADRDKTKRVCEATIK